MPFRREPSPLQLVIAFIGVVLLTGLVGIIVLAVLDRPVPDELGTVCIASMTALAGVLAPNTGLMASGRIARHAEEAGQAAAAAVVAVHAEDDARETDQAIQLGNDGRPSP
jgi:hypothetical protein